MDDQFFLKLEAICLLIVTNLAAFSLGMLMPMIGFDLSGYLSQLEVYHWLPIAIGIVFAGIGIADFVRRLNLALSSGR